MKFIIENNIAIWHPESVNLDKSIISEDFPERYPDDYNWLMKPINAGGDRKVKRIVNRNIGYTYLFITKLVQQIIYQKRKLRSNSWINLSSKMLRKYIPGDEVTRVKRILVNLGVIEENTKYKVGKWPMSFRFTEQHRKSALVEKNTDYGFLNRTVEKWRTPETNEDDNFLSWQTDNLKMIRLNPAAEDDFNNGKIKFKSPRAKSITQLQISNLLRYGSPEGGYVSVSRDTTIHRVYSQVTCMKKELREHLQLHDEPICTVDANACHPFLLLTLYQEEAIGPMDSVLIEKAEYYQLWDYNKRVGKRDFYSSFAALGKLDMSRSELKTAFYKNFLYCKKPKGKLGRSIAAVYEEYFPLLYSLMKKIKGERYLPKSDPYWSTSNASNHGQLAVMMFLKETEAFIDLTAMEIFEGKKFWFLTIHDAICSEPKNGKKVKDLLSRHLMSITGYKPVLDLEISGMVKSPTINGRRNIGRFMSTGSYRDLAPKKKPEKERKSFLLDFKDSRINP